MKRQTRKFYHFLIILPDVLYPFRNNIEGEWVRGMRSYQHDLRRAVQRYGPRAYGYKLSTYRQIFHFLGSLFVMYVATLIALDLVGSRVALFILLFLATLFITYQEFFLQRRVYRQRWLKGFMDWCVWCVPMGVYLFFR